MSVNEFDPKSNETTGYHIFLEPKGALKEELEASIARLAEEYGSTQCMPHVTLLSRIPFQNDEEVLKTASALAQTLQPCTVTLGELDSRDSYFRALYLRVREQETVATMHHAAAAAFSIAPSKEYVPHLSLLYGNYPHERIAETMQSLTYPKGEAFLADSLHVYRTPGTVDQWQKIGEIPFSLRSVRY